MLTPKPGAKIQGTVSRDEISNFIPEKIKTRFVILGTMASINGRRIDGLPAPDNPFFYNDNRNRFWKIMQILFNNEKDPNFPTREEKPLLLEKWGVAMGNIVSEMEIADQDKENASDEIIYEAFEICRVKFKTLDDDFKELLKTKPVFFTCKDKRIKDVLRAYYTFNDLDPGLVDKITLIHSPTRKSAINISKLWKKDLPK